MQKKISYNEQDCRDLREVMMMEMLVLCACAFLYLLLAFLMLDTIAYGGGILLSLDSVNLGFFPGYRHVCVVGVVCCGSETVRSMYPSQLVRNT